MKTWYFISSRWLTKKSSIIDAKKIYKHINRVMYHPHFLTISRLTNICAYDICTQHISAQYFCAETSPSLLRANVLRNCRIMNISCRRVVGDKKKLWSTYPVVILDIYLFTYHKKESFFILYFFIFILWR
jgi:hypothetical protein